MLKTVDLRPAKNQADYDRCMGMLSLLGAASGFGEASLTRAVAIFHCALKTENFRIYLGSNDRPSAAVTWAFMNEAAVERYLQRGFLADIADWTSGEQLWFPHIIAEGNKARPIIADLVQDPLFEGFDRGRMLRGSQNGPRRIVAFSRRGVKLERTL